MDKTVGTYLCECGKDFHSTWVFDNHRIRCIAIRESLEALFALPAYQKES